MPAAEPEGYGPAESTDGAHSLDGYGPPEPLGGAKPVEAATLPKQTGKRFIEPADDSLGHASTAPFDHGPSIDELRQKSAALGMGRQLAQPFVDIAKGAASANDFAARALRHPIDTLGTNPGATFREGMRGVNENIPFANSAVEALGGPAAESPDDAAAAPGARAFGNVAGMLPVGNMIGGVAAKGIEAAAPAVGRAFGRVGASAEDRITGRALGKLEERTYKRTRAGIGSDVVEDVVRRNPELRAAAGDDVKLAKATAKLKDRAGAELAKIYDSAPPAKLAPLAGEAEASNAIKPNPMRPGPNEFDEVTNAGPRGHETVGGDTVANPARGADTVPDLSKRGAAADIETAPTQAAAAAHVDVATTSSTIDKRIAELDAGTSEDAAVARQLETIRDELKTRLGKRDAVSLKELRAEQSAYQRRGYGKSMPGDDAGSARIAANREASKAVGDTIVRRVTGMGYPEAKAFAKANPNSTAARLFNANDEINAANKLEAGIADRSGRVQPEHGPIAAAKRIIRHAAIPAVIGGAAHGPGGALAAGVGAELLHAVPAVARGVAGAADTALAGIAKMVQAGQRPSAAVINRAVEAGVKASTIYDLMNRRPAAAQ